jgi:hypothetical protein
VARGLAADNDEALVAADLAPDGRAAVLRQAAKIRQPTIRGDLDKCGAVRLRNDAKLTAVVAGPSPGRGTLASAASEVSMAAEVVKVNLKRSESGLYAALT